MERWEMASLLSTCYCYCTVGSSGRRMTLGLELVWPDSRQPNLHSISGTEPVKWPDSCILHPA